MVKIKRGKSKYSIFTLLVVLTILLLSSFWGCSRQITGASFVQKDRQLEESLTIPALPIQSDHFKEISFSGINNYIPLIKKYASQFDVDWLLVLAVIKQESRFDHEAVSHKGAYGLMQIMPLTQLELMEKLGVEEAFTPRNNIKAGIFHLKSLYSFFSNISGEDRLKFTLAAYNAGLGRILDAQEIARYMGQNPSKWSSVQSSLAFLSKKSYTLHQRIWKNGYPPSGYFKNWQQTIDYVNLIMKHYDRYSLALR